jgi:hypothetical protein
VGISPVSARGICIGVYWGGKSGPFTSRRDLERVEPAAPLGVQKWA